MNILPNTVDILDMLSFPTEVKERLELYLDKPVQNVKIVQSNDLHILKSKAETSNSQWARQSLINLHNSISLMKEPAQLSVSLSLDVSQEDMKDQGYFDMRNLEDEDIF